MPARRERRGFGSIRKLPSGNFQARYAGLTGEYVTAPRTFLTRMDAEAWLRGERQLLQDDGWQPPKARLKEALREAENRRILFEAYAERWLETRRNSRGEPLRPLTRDKYRNSLRNHVYPTFGRVLLTEITRVSVREWYDVLDVGPTAKAQAYTTLRTILNTAVDEDELLAKNPARIRGAGVRARRKHLRPASAEELQAMVGAMPERLRLLVQLATWCALRSGELRELRRGDFRFGQDAAGSPFGWVDVSRGVVRATDESYDAPTRTVSIVGPPKTEAGVRSVSIPDFLVPVVVEHLERFTAPGLDGLLFPSAKDPAMHLSETTMNGRPAVLDRAGRVVKPGFGWREARRVAGREDLDFHDLRHTGASWAGEEGASLAELMYRLGHSTPSMAIHYQHSRLERDQELGRRLSARHAQSGDLVV